MSDCESKITSLLRLFRVESAEENLEMSGRFYMTRCTPRLDLAIPKTFVHVQGRGLNIKTLISKLNSTEVIIVPTHGDFVKHQPQKFPLGAALKVSTRFSRTIPYHFQRKNVRSIILDWICSLLSPLAVNNEYMR